ncbi:unnamed protein product [Trichogramma brassicae]|uniref:Protein real-time n=1 Tax=Trichogramma brassicae TaxID=86971 RepID=A0A6H5IM88_9HYME|nr:unnamed protein product [Trichogramma brassicae]
MCTGARSTRLTSCSRSTRRRRSSRTTSRAAGTTSTGRADRSTCSGSARWTSRGCSSPSGEDELLLLAGAAHLRGGPVAHGRGDQRLGPSGLAVDAAHRPRGPEHAPPLAARHQGAAAHHRDRRGQLSGDDGPRPHIARAPLLSRSSGRSSAARSYTYVLEGGVVPKNLYRADLEGTSAEHEHSLYHSVSLSRGQTHNVAIHCNDPGAVLTWDFDVMRNQVLFAVLHKEKSKDSNNTLAAPGATTVLEPDVVGSKEWKEGLDGIVRVEPSVVCHDGESIQYKSCEKLLLIKNAYCSIDAVVVILLSPLALSIICL